MKPCGSCGNLIPLIEYGNNPSSPDGKYSICKPCRAVKSKARRQRPEVKASEQERLRLAYIANRDSLLARRKARYQANKAREKANQLVWRANNLEHHRQLCRDWAKNHPDQMRIIVRNRRARVMSADGTHTDQDIKNLFVSQSGLCIYCKIDLGDDYHVDHIMPLIRGGGNGPDNLQLLCPTCNKRKGRKLPHEFASESGLSRQGD